MRKIVFLGNPNVGKSALINAISGSNIKIGNWPGVTVDKIEANYTYKNESFNLIDLPGTYHLGDNNAEEVITGKYLLENDYDIIVNVVDATNLERNLYLTLLARELQKPMILILNFYDEVTKNGLVIDVDKLSKYLQIPIFCTSATKGDGLVALKNFFFEYNKESFSEYNIYFDHHIDKTIVKIYDILNESKIHNNNYSVAYLTYRIFEKNPKFLELLDNDTVNKIIPLIDECLLNNDESSYSQLQNKRYNQLNKILKKVIDKKGRSRYELTRKIDRIVLHKYLGLPLFGLFSIYFLSLIFNVANPFVDWIDGFINIYLHYHLQALIINTPAVFQSLLLDGLLAGVGGILVFTPLMYFIYLLMGIVEESGYMSRIAFLMDRIMRLIGLDGKSFISIILGFGCTVPAITSTRTLQTTKSRKATAMMLPYISCGARLPVYALFGAAFFSQHIALFLASLYLIGIGVAIIAGLIMDKLNMFDDGKVNNFTVELPPYRIPEAKILFKNVNNRVKGFIKRVTSVIMIVLVAMWALNYFPNGNSNDSYLHQATNFIQPIFKPTGFGESQAAIAAIPASLVAKEAVVGTLQQLMDVTIIDDATGTTIKEQIILLKDATIASITSIFIIDLNAIFGAPTDQVDDTTLNKTTTLFTGAKANLQAYSYMVYILLLTPCVVALATVKKEFGTKFMIQMIIITLIVPYLAATIVYQVGSLIYF